LALADANSYVNAKQAPMEIIMEKIQEPNLTIRLILGNVNYFNA
jgi:hypothetical protein